MNTSVQPQNTALPDNVEAQLVNFVPDALKTIELGKSWLNKSYLAELEQFEIQTLPKNQILNIYSDVRLYKIERLSLENKQSMLESLTAMYQALGTFGCTVFLFLNCQNKKTDLYLGVKGLGAKGETGGELLVSAFNGHFAGSQFPRQKQQEILACLAPNSTPSSSVSALTCIPSLSLEEKEYFMQGLERFIDAAENNDFQALILADPISSQDLNYAQTYYENIATQLSPLLKQNISFNKTSSQSVGQSISKSITESFTQTETTGTSTSLAESETQSVTNTETNGTTKNVGGSMTVSTNTNIGIPGVSSGGVSVSQSINYSYGINQSFSTSKALSQGKTHTTSQNNSSAAAKGRGETITDAENTQEIDSQSQTISFDCISKNIEQIIQQIDCHLERIKEARSYGGWQTAAYFIAEKRHVTQSLASIFLGLTRGENSYSESSSISTWSHDKAKKILAWLNNFSHPQLDSYLSKNLNLAYLTPATLVSGKEMAIQLNLPRRSTSTVSVVEAQAFGRQIQSVNSTLENTDKVVNLGKIRHLWQTLPQSVELDVQKLASHIFVTGSTGSGKSNTVYQILNELNRNKVKFMVIEPAKGEYKNVFGHRDDVKVFGTNPKKTALLRINPFKFPDDIHVLEHIDRLIEIFNVCWPMYAAMPAILKDAMLEAYKVSGWDLENSYNRHPNLFPSFSDLLTQLKNVIASSAFSQEVRSNYEGSLVTRVKSLTNGLNGQIFSSDEIDSHILFDENVIVDLSRIGSQETKSLIMGILVMRLNEYRMSESTGMNESLKHVTVLEEAHNILKCTSTEQSNEGSNVAGKSVEMLSNAIAEMRTYGEGFIIADQSPSAVDISAIRNTNTKIIMRLPDESDRRLAGKASGITEEQLEELAKLPKGVAVIYQNDWLEPVLCQIHKFDAEEKLFVQPEVRQKIDYNAFNKQLAELVFHTKRSSKEKLNLEDLKNNIKRSFLPIEKKVDLFDQISAMKQGKVIIESDKNLMEKYSSLIKQSS
ncbi:Flp pilus assembly complex ATPase component TadA [Pasteurella multocida]|uniref:ATP-binding protein n=1 Tax=Pasteurella multocida TaxID=747 RepID=UPI0009F55247|nr:ATP-binding protein [Pasteurella multocida]MCL7840536.1 Flp pilus assembly complex ATPase component TadA [Pasteurella multocida]PNM10647.1 ATP-binding protein [Pasteurella multocida]URH91768.1 Flp pilus assembly complex ATPase component TadA [Pasteurella multocida]HDR1014169.1 ATP-binding protein [Pasteurella multocida]HDR1092026.1 ATP-binding protein [Pasteurella multocida]